MKDWYTGTMSPATASLAFSLLGHLKIMHAGDSGTTPKPAGLDVLETHCADAFAAGCVLPNSSVASYTACDFSEAMVGAAKERLRDRAVVLHADSTKLPFQDASFDRYMSNMGCCCVTDLDSKLREARRVLRPEGVAAMSMRIEGGAGDSSFALVAETLMPFGYPPGPDREGLLLGKDLQKVRKKLLDAGFKSAVAWTTWVTLPIHDAPSFVEFALGQPLVRRFLDSLDDSERMAAHSALRDAGAKALEQGAIQVATAAVVAQA